MRSLRSRILAGAGVWTLGLFIGGMLLSSAVRLHHQRSFPVMLHLTAETYWRTSLLIMIVCIVLGLRWVRSGLTPLGLLRHRLNAVHAGRAPRVEGRYPSEVQPLVDDLNALLAHRDDAVQRAIARAGDLAHGLKTPLAVLFHEAARARAAGQAEVADTFDAQLERMRRQIDYHLAHSRAAAAGASLGAASRIRESADALARTLARLHAARGLSIEVTVDPAHTVRVQRQDLDEMLGNLLDNACKWTRTRVAISSSAAGTAIMITVEDDGPGVPPSQRASVLQRGVKADEAAPGSGLGLAIVRDLAELYGGSISLDDAPGGGLRAELSLPAA